MAGRRKPSKKSTSKCSCPHEINDHYVCGCCKLCPCSTAGRECIAKYFDWHSRGYRLEEEGHPDRDPAVKAAQRFANEKLREFRLARGLSQEDFANKIGYTRQMVSAVEGGRSRPSVKFLEAIAREFSADLSYFWA